ncbi:MAG: phytanoyl-CoA dioxygenase family protein [Planctomycetes bacterium]|nr:phytanoyl-CoA dioxygenase family protein [Planctomycetota bacterium]
MRSELTQAQIDSYRENGFIVIPDFLTPEELAVWREAVDESVRIRDGRKLPGRPDWKGGGESYYENVFIQRLNLWKDNPTMRRLILDPRIGKMACDLEGIDAIRVWHDQTLIKEPWANPTSFHLDVPYWSFSSRHAVSIWVALDDATFENGCLFFLPGTHKTARFDNAGIGPNMNALFKIYPEFASLRSVAAPMKAGSCSFHNGLTAHGAHANMTPGFRRAMTCGFMPDGCTFNGKKNILSDEQIARLKIGDALRDEDQNPIVYARTRSTLP